MTELEFMPWLVYTALAWLFLSVGSFLNVVIHRLPIMLKTEWLTWGRDIIHEYAPEQEREKEEEQSPQDEQVFNLARPRSRCPNCGHMILAWQNIPLISWIMLRGRCANCDCKISARYPAVELLCTVLSFIVVSSFGFNYLSLCYLFLTWTLVALSFIDYDTKLLPDNLTLPLLWAGLLVNISFGNHSDTVGIQAAVIGASAGYLMLWLVYWGFKLATGKEGMGYGDFKLLAALGAWLGWQALPVTILLSSLAGLVIGGGLMLGKVISRDKPIPFGPFLALAGWIMLIWGDSLILLI